RSPPQGVLVVGGTVGETSSLLLALAHAPWLGQAFAHCPLKAPAGGDRQPSPNKGGFDDNSPSFFSALSQRRFGALRPDSCLSSCARTNRPAAFLGRRASQRGHHSDRQRNHRLGQP